ncbi:DarT ssDNA thymidine ADP-ribosyltransferase family protein [Sphingobium sp. HWE2-09]|uniref:DarT ssDNA thymidine ADP-ribosyltransferase family protein n=1 Tax=Sphingobium sp. HWE2-09 TaxID=3108390 RepID=UPI002DD0FD11|nr:DarT ssDNA thymidine ADP-ribosyltransferase family protein [Sphingobium sp. HWE2-09]
MALSVAFVDAHIKSWQTRLTSDFYAHRKHWPAYLFHHAPLENAVAILRDGYLRSRNDALNLRPRDVAAPGVIDARDHAHGHVRLYFRPKTPTQWHIEGIRKAGECNYGDATHAAVLVMFLLDARTVLTEPNIMFSDKNMQLAETNPGSDEAYFSQIPFMKVFSEGRTGGDRSFTDARCAEVLANSPLNLGGCLKAICLRSEPERETLLHLLGDQRRQWESYCHVSDTLRVFQKDYTFLQELRLTNEGVIFRLNPRQDRQNIAVRIDVWDSAGKHVIDFVNESHSAQPENPSSSWIWRKKLKDDIYSVKVYLENTLSYENTILLGDSLF